MASQSSTRNAARKPISVTVLKDAGSTAPAKPSSTGTRSRPYARNPDDVLQEVLNRLNDPTQTTRCVDVETSGLDWRHNAIIGYVVTFSANPVDSYYVPFRHAGNANVGERAGLRSPTEWNGKTLPGEKELIKGLDKPGTLLFGHNLAFDLRFMSRTGFTFQPRFEDTILIEPLLDEYGKFSLEFCANKYGVQAKLSSEIKTYIQTQFPNEKIAAKDAMGHFWRLSGDDRMAIEYAAGDGTTTWQLRDAQMVEIERQELGLVHGVESRLIPVLARMMVRGIKVDEERLGWLIDHIDAEVARLHDEFPSDFNARSPGDVQKWMEKHGHTDWPRTAPSKTRPSGSPSFPEAYLENHDAGQKVLKLRKWQNLNATFCLPLRDRHLWNGRVHTTFNQLRNDDYGTVTGRLSSNEPNLQQVPKHDEELGRLFRSAFVPDYGLWGDRDYSQIEPRLMAYYTRAKVFLNDFRTNPLADSHTAVAKDAKGAAWDEMSASEQKHFRNTWAKRVNQTVITGGGKRALMNKYKMSQREAEEALARYFRTVPELRPFQKRAARRFRERGYVISLLGRRMRLLDPDKDYTAFNRLLQTGNADILKIKMVELQEYLDSERADVEMLLNCHDALSFQFMLDGKSRKVYAECKRLMEDFSSESAVIKLDLPLRVDEGEGRDWAVATYGEKK